MKREYNGLFKKEKSCLFNPFRFWQMHMLTIQLYRRQEREGKNDNFYVFKGYSIIIHWNDVNEKIIAAGRSIFVCHQYTCVSCSALKNSFLPLTIAHMQMSFIRMKFFVYDAMKTMIVSAFSRAQNYISHLDLVPHVSRYIPKE